MMVQKETKRPPFIKRCVPVACFFVLFATMTLPSVCWANAEDGGTNLANTIKTRDAAKGANGVPAPANELSHNAGTDQVGDSEESEPANKGARVIDDACNTAGQDPYVAGCKAK